MGFLSDSAKLLASFDGVSLGPILATGFQKAFFLGLYRLSASSSMVSQFGPDDGLGSWQITFPMILQSFMFWGPVSILPGNELPRQVSRTRTWRASGS